MNRFSAAIPVVALWACVGVAAFLIARPSSAPEGVPAAAPPAPTAAASALRPEVAHVPDEVAAVGEESGLVRVTPRVPVDVESLEQAVARNDELEAHGARLRQRIDRLFERSRVGTQLAQRVRVDLVASGRPEAARFAAAVVDLLLDVGVRPSTLRPEVLEQLVPAYAAYRSAHGRWAAESADDYAQRDRLAELRRAAAGRFADECRSALPAADLEGDFEARLLDRLGESGA